MAFQRYLLQVGFADRLLGQLLQNLRANRLYDRSLIIVVSDHGISFRTGGNRRNLDETNLQDILNVPLLIKAPHQKQGQVSQRPTRTIDILPSIASILGVAPPWPTDGISVTETTDENRDLLATVPRSRFLHSRTTVCLEGSSFDVVHDARRVRLDEVMEDGDRILFFGWAADLATLGSADSILIFADEELVHQGMSRVPRPDLSRHTGTAKLEQAGFYIELDQDLFAGKSRVRLFASFGTRIRESSSYPIGFPWSIEPKPGVNNTHFGSGSCEQNEARSFLITSRRNPANLFPSPSDEFMAGLRELKWNRSADGLFRFGQTAELLGKRLDQVSTIDSSRLRIRLEKPELYEEVDLSGHFVPAGIEGEISGETAAFVAVAVNGYIRAVAPIFRVPSGERHFQAIVPESSFVNGRNAIRALAVAQTKQDSIALAAPVPRESVIGR